MIAPFFSFQLQDNEPAIVCAAPQSEGHRYEMSIKTGIWLGAGTTARVSFIINGVAGNSGTINLNLILNPIFARGTEQNCVIYLHKDIGEIYSLRIWHDNSGEDPSWFLDAIEITDSSSGSCWKFIFETWLSLEDESFSNGMLQSPSCSGPSITTKLVKEMFSNGHLWLSVITKTPGDSFTRVQRISFCFSLLLCTMAVNATFYYWGTHSSQTINLGPLTFSTRQAIVSIQSNLFILPLHVIILLFKRSTKRLQGERSRLCLLFITFTFLAIVTTASAGVTVSYSLMWGKDKSQEWISSVITSFFEDIIIVQPFKCLLLVSLSVMFSKWKANKVSSHRQCNIQTSPEKANAIPTSAEVSNLREESVARAKRRSSISLAFFYVTFLVVLGVLSYGNRNSARYRLTRSLDNHIGNFTMVGNDVLATFNRKTCNQGLLTI